MINKSLSIYLDLLRFLAAVVVLLSHFAYARYTGGRYLVIRDLNLGSDAVVIFFVLSGLVIALTSRVKDKTLGNYAFNRATRMFSVAVPTLVLAFALDRIGAAIDPVAYSGWWYNPVSFGRMLWSGLTFSSEWTGQQVRLGTNGPYWSLSYEVAYYVLFGAAMFLKGPKRWAVLGLSVLVFGFNVLILLPAWVIGVWLFHRLQRPDQMASAQAPVLAIAPWLVYIAMLALDVPQLLTNVTANVTSAETVAALRFSDEFLWNWLIAVCFTVHLMAMSVWLEHRKMFAIKAIRWLAGGSFSLYLLHYPLIQFFSAVLPKSGNWFVDDALLLGLTVAVCFIFAEIFERRLGPRRKRLQAAFRRTEQKQPVPTS